MLLALNPLETIKIWITICQNEINAYPMSDFDSLFFHCFKKCNRVYDSYFSLKIVGMTA
jgi:hypothetical protein